MRHRQMYPLTGMTAVMAAAGFAAGCASNEVSPEQASLVRAEAEIQEAEQSGAYEHGSSALESARNKLSAAREALGEGDEERAGRLATEAELDAEYAAALASNQRMQSAADEVDATIETLQQELSRLQ